jgi:hypothetical protein
MTRVKGRRPVGSRVWEPMAPARNIPISPEKRAALLAAGSNDEEIDALARQEVWRNNLYVVMIERHPNGWITELSIRRMDRQPVHDWRDFQRIKTEIAGAHVEAVEIYPAENRLMDTANQYYLYCLPPGMRLPFGYDTGRNVRDTGDVLAVGAVQRPLPDDWKNWKN